MSRKKLNFRIESGFVITLAVTFAVVPLTFGASELAQKRGNESSRQAPLAILEEEVVVSQKNNNRAKKRVRV